MAWGSGCPKAISTVANCGSGAGRSRHGSRRFAGENQLMPSRALLQQLQHLRRRREIHKNAKSRHTMPENMPQILNESHPGLPPFPSGQRLHRDPGAPIFNRLGNAYSQPSERITPKLSSKRQSRLEIGVPWPREPFLTPSPAAIPLSAVAERIPPPAGMRVQPQQPRIPRQPIMKLRSLQAGERDLPETSWLVCQGTRKSGSTAAILLLLERGAGLQETAAGQRRFVVLADSCNSRGEIPVAARPVANASPPARAPLPSPSCTDSSAPRPRLSNCRDRAVGAGGLRPARVTIPKSSVSSCNRRSTSSSGTVSTE